MRPCSEIAHHRGHKCSVYHRDNAVSLTDGAERLRNGEDDNKYGIMI